MAIPFESVSNSSTFLAEDAFVRISHALAVVGLGWSEGADLRRDLAPERQYISTIVRCGKIGSNFIQNLQHNNAK
jgi:hypothetical protein